MANQEQLDLLKRGIQTWNQWRMKHPKIQPNLSEVDLSGADFSRADFSKAHFLGTNLSEANLGFASFKDANLRNANLNKANLRNADFSRARLFRANLSEAFLYEAFLYRARLSEANLQHAILLRANLQYAILSRATLNPADLSEADLSGTDLRLADLSGSQVGLTHFDDLDLRQVKGLETIEHKFPSRISISTIYRSEGNIPEIFLRKAGVPDSFIEYMRSLVVKPIDYYTCFISYSSQDQAFAEQLYADLQQKGVRCWFAPHDMKIGDEIRTRIDESVRQYDKLLLLLSTHALASDWVQAEVEIAFEKERNLKQQGRPERVLFPICLDERIMETSEAWATAIRRTRHIGDFTKWKQHDDYQQAFERLLRDLKAENLAE